MNHFDQPFVDQGIQHVVDPTGTNTDGLGQFTLRYFRVFLQKSKYAKMCVLL